MEETGPEWCTHSDVGSASPAGLWRSAELLEGLSGRGERRLLARKGLPSQNGDVDINAHRVSPGTRRDPHQKSAGPDRSPITGRIGNSRAIR